MRFVLPTGCKCYTYVVAIGELPACCVWSKSSQACRAACCFSTWLKLAMSQDMWYPAAWRTLSSAPLLVNMLLCKLALKLFTGLFLRNSKAVKWSESRDGTHLSDSWQQKMDSVCLGSCHQLLLKCLRKQQYYFPQSLVTFSSVLRLKSVTQDTRRMELQATRRGRLGRNRLLFLMETDIFPFSWPHFFFPLSFRGDSGKTAGSSVPAGLREQQCSAQHRQHAEHPLF